MVQKPVTVREMIQHASDWAEARFKEHGQITSQWHAIDNNGNLFVIAPPCSDKQIARLIIRLFFEQSHIVRYIHMDEGWLAQVDTLAEVKKADEIGISQHPDRREVVVFSAEDLHEHAVGWRYILRPEHRRAVLSPLKMSDDPKPLGPMFGMLRGVQDAEGR